MLDLKPSPTMDDPAIWRQSEEDPRWWYGDFLRLAVFCNTDTDQYELWEMDGQQNLLIADSNYQVLADYICKNTLNF